MYASVELAVGSRHARAGARRRPSCTRGRGGSSSSIWARAASARRRSRSAPRPTGCTRCSPGSTAGDVRRDVGRLPHRRRGAHQHRREVLGEQRLRAAAERAIGRPTSRARRDRRRSRAPSLGCDRAPRSRALARARPFLTILSSRRSPPGAGSRSSARRSTPSRISRTCRSSSSPSGWGRAPTSSRTRSPIRSRRRCIAAPQGASRARAVDVRDVVRQRHLRGRHRHLLGAQPRARVPELGPRASCPPA